MLDELARALAATDEEGRLRFSYVDVEDFLAVLLLTEPAEARAFDDEAHELLGRFAQRAGATDPATAEARIAAYLEARPLQRDIVAAAARVARERVAGRGATGDALARFAGDADKAGVLGGGARPAGTVPAGPLARFLVDKK